MAVNVVEVLRSALVVATGVFYEFVMQCFRRRCGDVDERERNGMGCWKRLPNFEGMKECCCDSEVQKILY